MCIHTADSLCCTAGTKTTLLRNYTPRKKKKKAFCENSKKAPNQVLARSRKEFQEKPSVHQAFED